MAASSRKLGCVAHPLFANFAWELERRPRSDEMAIKKASMLCKRRFGMLILAHESVALARSLLEAVFYDERGNATKRMTFCNL